MSPNNITANLAAASATQNGNILDRLQKPKKVSKPAPADEASATPQELFSRGDLLELHQSEAGELGRVHIPNEVEGSRDSGFFARIGSLIGLSA